ncbi:MAG: efflux RND transporter permease subunit [Oceanobacter sp.]
MSERFFNFVLNRPWLVIAVSLVFVLAAAAGGKNLVFKSDYRVFFSEENPQLMAFESMQKVYSKSDNVAFILSPKDGAVFTQDTLASIQTLTDAAWQIPYSTRVDSITNYQHTEAEEDDLYVTDLVTETESLMADDMAAMKAIATQEPLLVNKLLSESAQVTLVNVTIQLPGIDPTAEVPEVVSFAREMKANFEMAHPDIEVRLSGIVMLNNAFAESSLGDQASLVPMMFGMVLLMMIFLLRSFTGTFASLIIIVFSILSTMGLAGWAGFFLTGPSAATPIMVLTLAVADCVHILASMFYDMRHGATKRDALMHSLKLNLSPVFLTSATTAIGFLSMNFSDSPPFNDLGNMVAAGVMLAFVFSVTTFPALLKVLPLKVKVVQDDHSGAMEKLADFVIAKRKALLPGMAVLMAALVILLPNNVLNDDFVKYFDTSVPFRQATDYMAENMSGLTTIEVSISSGESSGINEPSFVKALGDFTDWLRAQPETDHVNSLSDTLKRLNKNMHGDDDSFYSLPQDRELSAQYLLLYEMSLPYGLDLNNQLDVDKSATRVIVTFRNLTSNEQLDIENRIYQWFSDNAPAVTAEVASPTLMFAHIGQRNIQSMLGGTAIALVLISFLLAFALRSAKFGLISLLPNMAPAAMGFGVWFLIDGQIGLALSVVAGMTLGIVVDDTVHFLSKYLHARRDKGYATEAAVRYAFSSVGRALVITTTVLAAGFMVLAQSTFKLNADMGLLTAITIVIALVVDFLFLPPLLMLLDKDQHAAAENSESTPAQASSNA